MAGVTQAGNDVAVQNFLRYVESLALHPNCVLHRENLSREKRSRKPERNPAQKRHSLHGLPPIQILLRNEMPACPLPVFWKLWNDCQSQELGIRSSIN